MVQNLPGQLVLIGLRQQQVTGFGQDNCLIGPPWKMGFDRLGTKFVPSQREVIFPFDKLFPIFSEVLFYICLPVPAVHAGAAGLCPSG